MVSENRRPTRHDEHETSGLPTPVLRSVVLRMNDAFPKLDEVGRQGLHAQELVVTLRAPGHR